MMSHVSKKLIKNIISNRFIINLAATTDAATFITKDFIKMI